MRFTPQPVPSREQYQAYLGDEFKRVADAVRFFFHDGVDGLVIQHDNGENAFSSVLGGESILYWGGTKRLNTFEYGARIRGDDADTITQFYLDDAAGNPIANLGAHPTSGYFMYSFRHGLPVAMLGEDAGGTPRNIFAGDPDGGASAYYAGSARATTNAYGLTVGNGGDVSPSSAGIGQLNINGNGYDGFIALNSNAMHVGHNSASRGLGFMVDETIQYYISNTGYHQFNYNGATHFVMNGTNAYIQATTGASPYFAFYGSDANRDMYLQAASDSVYYWIGENNGVPFQIRGDDAGGTQQLLFHADPDNYTELRSQGTIGIRVGASTVGFFGSTGTTKPNITGSRGGNAALANLLTALANLGLLTNSTT